MRGGKAREGEKKKKVKRKIGRRVGPKNEWE